MTDPLNTWRMIQHEDGSYWIKYTELGVEYPVHFTEISTQGASRKGRLTEWIQPKDRKMTVDEILDNAEELVKGFESEDTVWVRATGAGKPAERSIHATFERCPQCDGGEMMPEHAHYRCRRCGFRDSCCD